ncbi:MAG TPA: hypothetical protein VGD67_12740 [Pseudonocardiaceae bacterium]
MSAGDLITDKDLPTRLKLVNVLPVTIVLATTTLLLLSGAPRQSPSLEVVATNIRSLGWPTLVIGTAVSLIAGLALQPLELASIRLLEGYWRPQGLLGPAGRLGCWVHERRRSRLQWLVSYEGRGVEGPLASDAVTELQSYPDSMAVLPTALGNRLRAMEERAGAPYHLDAIHAWPRLYFVLPQDALDKVNAHRNELDVTVRLSIAGAITGLISASLLIRFGWWLVLPAAFLLAAAFAYRSSLAAATNYRVAVCAAFDVHRLRLHQTMRLQMPVDSDHEQAINAVLNGYWRRNGAYGVLRYATTDQDVGITVQRRRGSPPPA